MQASRRAEVKHLGVSKPPKKGPHRLKPRTFGERGFVKLWGPFSRAFFSGFGPKYIVGDRLSSQDLIFRSPYCVDGA